MPVHYILGNLLAANDRALAALFLDEAGETVDLACSENMTPYQARITGAYLGIYLRQLAKLCKRNSWGLPQQMHIEREGLHIYAQALPDGYYLVLLQSRPGLVARARRSLAGAVGDLEREFFAT